MLTNTTEIGTATLPRRRLTIPAPTDVSPSAPRRPPRFPALAWAALALLGLLAHPSPAAAQTDVWTATLTPADLGRRTLGCDNSASNFQDRCSTSTVLSDDDFTHDSTDYTVTALTLRGRRLTLTVDEDITTATNALSLDVDGTSLSLADAAQTSNRTRTWTTSALSWTDGTDVSVSLTATSDTTLPVLTSATVSESGENIALVFTEDVQQTYGPPASAFAVTVGGSAVTVTDVLTSNLGEGLIAVAPPISQGQAVVVTYTDPTTGDDANAIQDAAGNDAASFTTGSDGVAAVANESTVANKVPANWSLAPTGLAVGAKFRLLFLSSTKRDGSSTDIADYNTFVQGRAAAGHASIQAYGAGFRAVGCTSAVDARDNTGTTYTTTDKGIPIYWLNGAKATDDYEDFYDGDWDDEANDKNESGTDAHDTSLEANYPLTGCKHDGTEAFRSSAENVSRGLGASGGFLRTGRPNSSNALHGPIGSNHTARTTDTRPMYGLSAVFEVVGEDTTPPTLTSAVVTDTGLVIELEFSENLQSSNLPPASAFTVTAGGAAVTVSAVAAGTTPDGFQISVSPLIAQDQAVVVTYADPTTGDDANAIQDTVGNDTPDFTTGSDGVPAVTNNSTVPTAVPANWSLKPTGLTVGDQFRLLFLSSTKRDGSSTDIADYNTFVQARAAAGHVAIQAYSADFRVVGCTEDTDARDNTSTTYTTTDKGVPIYWLDGAQAADEYEDFYDGSWDDVVNSKNESGTAGLDTLVTRNSPYTGCKHDGTEARGATISRALGSTRVRIARPKASPPTNGPLSSNQLQPSSVTLPMYGLSPVLQVAAAVSINNPPAFSGTTADRSVAENTAAGQNVGAAVTATDADSDTLTYTLEGADATSFDMVTTAASAQIRTKTGVIYNHEAQSSYTVIVKADDGNGGTATVTVTITVTDVNEPPGRPEAPSVSATAGSDTSLDVSWTAPSNTGPAIASYDLQYRQGASGDFTNGPQDVTGTSAAIGSLAPGTAYQVQVRATNAEGDGDWSFAGTGQTLTFVPGAPTALSAAASGSTRINLSWTAPASDGGSAITGYRIEVSSDGGATWTDRVANTGITTTYAHTGLAAGDTRHYRVSAINTHGAGAPSDVANATTETTVPGAPTALSAAASGSTRINLSWTAPASDGGSAITGYRIEVSSDGGATWTDRVANTGITTTTYEHPSLAAVTTRHYRVSAINTHGAGAPSDVANATTETTVPGAPTALSAAASGSTRINLSWTAPASDGGSAITGYRIEVSSDGGATWTDRVANTGITTTYAHTGLAAGTTRHYRVSAINTHGAGAPSDVASATTETTVPGAPTALSAAASGSTQINLTWTAPASDGGSAITGYKIEVSPNGTSGWTDRVADTGITTTTYAHTGLAPGDTRHYRVSAISTDGSGTASNVATATTETTVPGAPTALSAAASGSTRINLTWTAPASDGGSAITGYKIEVSPNGTSGWTDQVANTTTTTTTYAHTGLAPGDTRHYRVSAISTDGSGTASNVANATTETTVPGAPTALSAAASGATQINLSWTAPASDGGSAITGYRIEVSSDGGSNWTDRVADTGITTTTYSHTGLTAGTTRHYRVSAINTHGAGAPSDVANATTAAGTAVPADWTLKPTGLAAGARFRLLFLSSTRRDGSSTDIADYNTFVQTHAAAGHAAIQAYSAGFRAVGCTADTDARDNTSTTYTTADKGVPIYWLNGAKAADEYEDFYDGSWDDEANDKNESGTAGFDTSQEANFPATGCMHDGTEAFMNSSTSLALGSSNGFRVARPNSSASGDGPIQGNGLTVTTTGTRPMYGLSAVFEVAAAVGTNNPPTFPAAAAARSVAENTAAGQDVGAVLTATDADSHTLTYTLEGADAASFDIVTTAASAQIRTKTGVTYNHEAQSSYTVIVKADDGNGGTDTITVTITVTDVDEPPGVPAAPSVSATAGSTTSLDVSWTAPSNTGPAITSYDLQYRQGARGTFTVGPQDVTGASAAIGSLAPNTWYEVQVRATNAEGDGEWSFAGTRQTNISAAATEVPANWSLAPTGLAVGAKFRLLFLSSTKRDGSSTDIADYNTFVQGRAAAGHASIQAYGAGFRAVGCTSAVDARDNTGTTYTTTDKGIPIYWLNGAKATDDYEDFYDGDWDDEANDKNESGTDAHDTSLEANYPLTGCKHDGTEAFRSSAENVSRGLGASGGFLRTGRPNSSNALHGPIGSNHTARTTDTRPMYGLSAVFEVVGEDTTPPTLTSAVVTDTGLVIELEFSENLQSSNLPPASAFTVTAGGAAVTVSAVAAGTTPDGFQISVSPLIAQDQAVVVTYADPTTGDDANAIQDTVGNDTPDFTTGSDGVPAVTNNSTVPTAVPANWSLKPTGLTVGDQFRLLFLSSTKRDGSSTDIADYNTFVQARAAAGHVAIQAYSADFRVVGCTEDTDARDNTSTTYTSTDKGVPIYWLNGAKAADQYEDFYDGSWDDVVNSKNESGTAGLDTLVTRNSPWTGCEHDGTEAFGVLLSRALGAAFGFVRIGRPKASPPTNGPLSSNQLQPSSVTLPLYGLSAVFQVAAAVVVINNPPAFSGTTAARNVAENTAAGQNVGAVLTATDADSDTLTYTLEGADAASFDIVSGSGQIRTRTGVTYNHEAKSTYTVVVKADDGNGGTDTIAVTITVTDVDEPPGQPAAPSVSATAGSTTSLDVTWTAPTNTGPAIASYDLQYRAGTSGNFTDGPQNVTGTSAAIGSLAADTSYEVQVRATNAEGDGDWSVAGTGRTTATSAPGAPTGLTATASGTTQIDLSWSAPASIGGSAITGYRIEVSSNGTSGWTDQVANTNSTATTYAHTGLAAGDTRHYRVSAINANGAGTASNVDSATTGTSVPGAPTGLTATASGATQIDLSWSAPASTGGSAITGYKIEVSLQRHLRLDRPGRQHQQHRHHLRPHRARRRHHPPLPRLRHQHQRRRHRLQRRQRHHRHQPPCPAPPPASRPTASGTTRSTSPGAPRRAPAAPPSPATRSRSRPTAPPAGPTRSPTPTAPPPPTRTPGSPPATPATTACPPSTPTAPAPPPTSTAPPPAPACPAPRPASRPRPAGPPRSTSPGAPRAAPAAPPSPATRSRSRPTASPAGPTSSPTRAIPPPPTRTPG